MRKVPRNLDSGTRRELLVQIAQETDVRLGQEMDVHARSWRLTLIAGVLFVGSLLAAALDMGKVVQGGLLAAAVFVVGLRVSHLVELIKVSVDWVHARANIDLDSEGKDLIERTMEKR